MPDKSKIHQDSALTGISVRYKNETYLADIVSPHYPVKHLSNKYYIYSKDNFRLEESRRSSNGEAREVNWDMSTGTYTLERHSFKHLVGDDDKENADPGVDLEKDATEVLTDKILLRKEKSLIDLIHTNGNWANESSLGAAGAWSANTTASNPILVVDSATTAIVKNSGKRANVAIMDLTTFKAAKNHTSILDLVKYTSADSITEAMLAKLFNIKNVYVSQAVENSAAEGLSDSQGFLMTDVCWVGYLEKAPGLMKPSAFYTLFKGQKKFEVKRWREEGRDGVFIEVNSYYQHKPIATDCGYLIVNTVQ